MTRRSAELRAAVCEANLELHRRGLVMGTFGNVSGLDRDAGLFFIKPSGVTYDRLTPDRMVPVSLESGEVLAGELRPSSDTATHLELYRAFGCGGVAHCHSEYATAFAQANLPIACMGTTHADSFRRDVPVTRSLSRSEVESEYERNTGLAIVERFTGTEVSATEVPAVLVAHHGPFTWGPSAAAAVEHAAVLEFVARIEWARLALAPDSARPADYLVAKHWQRKHGLNAYYGQRGPEP